MHVKEISYTGTFHLGDHNFEKITCSFHLNQGEDEQFSLREAKKIVHDFHNGGRPVDDYSKENFLSGNLPEIQQSFKTFRSYKEGNVQFLLKEMDKISSEYHLIKWGKIYLITYPELEEKYEIKLKELQVLKP